MLAQGGGRLPRCSRHRRTSRRQRLGRHAVRPTRCASSRGLLHQLAHGDRDRRYTVGVPGLSGRVATSCRPALGLLRARDGNAAPRRCRRLAARGGVDRDAPSRRPPKPLPAAPRRHRRERVPRPAYRAAMGARARDRRGGPRQTVHGGAPPAASSGSFGVHCGTGREPGGLGVGHGCLHSQLDRRQLGRVVAGSEGSMSQTGRPRHGCHSAPPGPLRGPRAGRTVRAPGIPLAGGPRGPRLPAGRPRTGSAPAVAFDGRTHRCLSSSPGLRRARDRRGTGRLHDRHPAGAGTPLRGRRGARELSPFPRRRVACCRPMSRCSSAWACSTRFESGGSSRSTAPPFTIRRRASSTPSTSAKASPGRTGASRCRAPSSTRSCSITPRPRRASRSCSRPRWTRWASIRTGSMCVSARTAPRGTSGLVSWSTRAGATRSWRRASAGAGPCRGSARWRSSPTFAGRGAGRGARRATSGSSSSRTDGSGGSRSPAT